MALCGVLAIVPAATLLPVVCNALAPPGSDPGERPVRFGLVRLAAAAADLPILCLTALLAGKAVAPVPLAWLLSVAAAVFALGSVEVRFGSTPGTWLAGLRVVAPSPAAAWCRGLVGSAFVVCPVALLGAGMVGVIAGLTVLTLGAITAAPDHLAGTRLASGPAAPSATPTTRSRP